MRSRIPALLLIVALSAAVGQAQTTTWNGNAGDGIFGTAGNWDNGVPTSTENAVINPATAVTVTMNAAGSVLNLTVGSGDILAAGNNTLNISGTSISNAGQITTGNDFFNLNESATLSGAGTFTLGNGTEVEEVGTSLTLTNSGNTIQGAGQLGTNGLAVNNSSGTVNANVSGQTLSMDGGGQITNTALLEATNGGTLAISNNVTNTGGNITANGGTVAISNNAIINGGTLNSLNSGTLEATGNDTLQNVTISTGSTYNGAGNTTNLVGTITNNGTLATNNGFLIASTGDVTLTGGGVVQMTADPFIQQEGNTSGFTLHNVNNTIQGTGEIGRNGLALDNQAGGTVNANISAGTLSLDGGGAVSNAGLLEATNGGILSIGNNVTNTGAGAITANGGSVTITGSAVINGGPLSAVNGGTIGTSGVATLENVTISSGTTYGGGGTTNFIGTITNQGTITSANNFLTVASANVILTGGGTISTTSDAFINQPTGSSGFKLTNVNNLIEGSGQIGQDDMAFDNQAGGTVNANLNTTAPATLNATLSLNGGGTMTNEGLLEATNNGVLDINNLVTQSSGGVILANGGTVNLLTATIIGGTLTGTGGGTIGTDGSATLENLTISTGTLYGAGSSTSLVGTINNQGTITSNDQFITVTGGDVTLTGSGTVQMNSDTFFNEGGAALTLHNAGNTIQGTGELGQDGLSIDNQAGGTILANVMGGTLNIDGTGNVSNAGTFEASGGGKLVNPANTPFTTFNAGTSTLSGGTYIVNGAASATSTIELNLGTNLGGEIINNAGTLILNGPNANTLFEDASGNNSLTLLAANTTSTSGLTLEGGYSFQTIGNFSNAGAVVVGGSGGSAGTLTVGVGLSTYTQTGGTTQINSGGLLTTGATGTVHIAGGTVTMAGGTLTTNVLTNDSTGTLVGNGTVGGLGLGSATNQGLVEANGGALTFNANVQGTSGTLQVNPGATLTLANGLAGGTAPSTTGTLTQSGTLNIGANNVTVSTIYTNPNFGVGNNFNNHADVQGTGQLLAAGNAALTVTGSAVSGPTATPTLTLPNYHTGSSASATYAINNVGTTGPSVTGAIQTGAPGGGNITASNLSGTGVTASNFAQLADGQSTSAYTVTVGGGTAGPLAGGQTIHVASNFDNVAGPTVSLAGGTGYNLAQANTQPTPVALGNVHVNGTLGTNLSISNLAPTGAYTEGLGVAVTGTSGGASTTGTIGTPLVAGAAPNTAIAVKLNTGTAGALSGSATLGFTSVAVAGSGLSNTTLSSQTVNVTGAAYNLASASLGTINLGNVLVGSVVNPTLSVMNSGAPGAYTEGLDASVAGYSGGTASSLLTSTNSLTNLVAGGSSNLTFTLNTSSPGTLSGNVLVNLASDGATTSGLGITGLAQQSATASGTIMANVGNLASPNAATPNPVTLNARLGAASPMQPLSITNETAVGEGLNASISTTSSGITASGSFTSLGGSAGGGVATNSTSLVVKASTATAGAISGTATIALASDGSFNGGVTTPLPSQTITVNGGIYQPAVASTLPTGTVALGNVRIGGTLSQALSIGNAAPGTGGYTETLGASFSGTTGSSTSAVGGPILVASGTGPNTTMSVGLTTGTAGALSGSATVAFTTNAINGSGLGTAGIGSQTVNLSGAVYQPAVGATSLTTGGTPLPTTVAIGTVRTGTVVNTGLTVSNAAPTTAGPTYTETLGASFASGASAGLTPAGSASGLIAGGASSTALSVSYTAGAPGAYTGSATVNYVTQAVNGSGLGTMGVGSSTVGFTSTVNALANGVVQTVSGGYSFTPGTNSGTLNFGTVTLGVGSDQENLDLLNIVAGGVPADMLTGNFVTTALAGSPFGFGGSTSIGDLTANGSGDPFDITFNTNAGTGLFSETVTIDEASHNSSQSDLNLTPYTLTIDGTINPVGTPTVPDSGTTALFLGLGLLGLALAGRRFRRTA